MQTLEQKIIKAIDQGYMIEISSFVDISEDSYQDGSNSQGVNFFTPDTKVFKTSTLNSIQELLKESVYSYLNTTVYYYSGIKDEHISIIDDRLCISQLVDVDNQEPTDQQIKSWRSGNITLYTQDINITITINGISLGDDILSLIFPKADI